MAHPVYQSQIAAPSRRQKADKESHGEFESERTGYAAPRACPAKAADTFYTGTLKGVGQP
jgi:hypothetical protein